MIKHHFKEFRYHSVGASVQNEGRIFQKSGSFDILTQNQGPLH